MPSAKGRPSHNLTAAIDGRAKRPFRFSTLGQLATVGRRSGVANVLGINFSGFTAWWLWRTVYLMKLPRLEKKIRVALGWTLDLIFTKDIIRHHPLRSRHLQGDEAGRSGPLREEDRLQATVRGYSHVNEILSKSCNSSSSGSSK